MSGRRMLPLLQVRAQNMHSMNKCFAASVKKVN
jgi:hypothetical protein